MRNLLKPVLELSDNNEFQRQLAHYERISKSKEWEFVRDTFLVIKSRMLSDMLSREFTNLDDTEKDVQQRVYYHLHQTMEFLSNPTQWIRYKKRFIPTERPGVKPNQKGGT
ncbi:unnamed protein product [marine sediment metagenome]|uniref:Uncharacterized protein n=1 Tax=marine sediment metagenome TaxID=412755 RepID=X0XPP2_9ZZZZ